MKEVTFKLMDEDRAAILHSLNTGKPLSPATEFALTVALGEGVSPLSMLTTATNIVEWLDKNKGLDEDLALRVLELAHKQEMYR